MTFNKKIVSFFCLFVLMCFIVRVNAQSTRVDKLLNNDWLTVANDTDQHAFSGFEQSSFPVKEWKQVDVPHNWDGYEGYRRKLHGNRHGYSWYRKSFVLAQKEKGKRYFLWFEGVGSYATVWLNGKPAGYHAGGRTSFTIDVTDLLLTGNKQNLLAVRADHPAFPKDLPWVCGGCSDERGFSEGSQPMGIFRPVHLMTTSDVRITPFGVHAWNDTAVSAKHANVYATVTIKNYSQSERKIIVQNSLADKNGKIINKTTSVVALAPGDSTTISPVTIKVAMPQLWSLQNPYLYKLSTVITENGKTIDELKTPVGIRTIHWSIGERTTNQFFLNGKPVFINGIAEYEHLLGQSHAFSEEQIRSRVMMIKAAGFNAFRDAHQPHNLRYQAYWDKLGLLWWTQMSAHVWYDSPAFRENFKELLKEWVIERRNCPSLVLWGLQNESKLPADFAKECTELIRQLDPTASVQRKVTTCNGGEGTDWDVPQNWTGTYGGDPLTYASDVKRQVLIGEYGAWRTIDLHTEGGFVQNGALSEDRMTQLMEMKVRLAESVKDSSSGQFFWLLTSHDNPGRVQGGEGLRELDRIGPVNYKGLLTPWEEPLDVFYMFRSNYAPKDKEPMLYIVSHTWPGRWTKPGKKDGIIVYSNCDEVELFNDVNHVSLGKRKRKGIGTHFQWNGVDIKYNVLYAVGYVNGKAVAKDYITLQYLPVAPHFKTFYEGDKNITKSLPGYQYLYRVNCGGDAYKDVNGKWWKADVALPAGMHADSIWGSKSWTVNFSGMPAYFASQRRTFDPVKGTRDWPLFQHFRYGRNELSYEFPVPDGNYMVELYFAEPWLGTGGSMDCSGWRLFDVAINNKTVLKDLDIWKEAGHDAALKKIIPVKVVGGKMVISFPRVAAGQAVISAIAIASKDALHSEAPAFSLYTETANAGMRDVNFMKWLDTGKKPFRDDDSTFFIELPAALYGADWVQTTSIGELITMTFNAEADVFIALDEKAPVAAWLKDYEDTRTVIKTGGKRNISMKVYRKRLRRGDAIRFGDEPYLHRCSIIINPATSIEPAYDLKPSVSYRVATALLAGNVQKDTVNQRETAVFKSPGAGSVEWSIDVGVADTYSLTFRYANPSDKILEGEIALLQADGTLLKRERAQFTPSKPGKWNYLPTSTGSMINAGLYRVRVILSKGTGVGLSGLDVQ
jgi:beta-galactosidase